LTAQSTAQPSKQEHNLFAVMGQKVTGRASALIVAATEADAEYYALQELEFITVLESQRDRSLPVGHQRTENPFRS